MGGSNKGKSRTEIAETANSVDRFTADHAKKIGAAERIRGRMQLAAESIIEVGRELINQKKSLGHGNYLAWIEAEFQWSERTAANYIKVYNEFGSNSQHVANMSFRALTALAYSPPEVRAEVEERAAKGEMVTAAEIEKLKKQLAYG